MIPLQLYVHLLKGTYLPALELTAAHHRPWYARTRPAPDTSSMGICRTGMPASVLAPVWLVDTLDVFGLLHHWQVLTAASRWSALTRWPQLSMVLLSLSWCKCTHLELLNTHLMSNRSSCCLCCFSAVAPAVLLSRQCPFWRIHALSFRWREQRRSRWSLALQEWCISSIFTNLDSQMGSYCASRHWLSWKRRVSCNSRAILNRLSRSSFSCCRK